jgi:hypothetical protein
MPVTDDQLAQLIHDLSATVPAPTDLSQRLAIGLQRRHRRRRIAVAASTIVVAASVTVATMLISRSPSPGHGTGLVGAPADSSQPAATQLLSWAARGDLAGDHAYVTSATTAAESPSSSITDGTITHDPRALYVGTVPGGRTAAIVEGLDDLGDPVVVALSGTAGETPFHVEDGHQFTGPLDSTELASNVSFALARPDATGFALVVGAPGTTAIDLSIAPRQNGSTFGPDFQNLPLADGVGTIELPAGADPLSVFYTVAGPHASSDYRYPYFTSSR